MFDYRYVSRVRLSMEMYQGSIRSLRQLFSQVRGVSIRCVVIYFLFLKGFGAFITFQRSFEYVPPSHLDLFALREPKEAAVNFSLNMYIVCIFDMLSFWDFVSSLLCILRFGLKLYTICFRPYLPTLPAYCTVPFFLRYRTC